MKSAPQPPMMIVSPSRSHIPHARLISVLLRTAHLVAISVLVGAHAYHAPARQLLPLLWVAILTGAGMAFIEAYPHWSKLAENWAYALYVKLALLCAIPFLWRYRFPILIVVVVIGGLMSHATRNIRHGSPFRTAPHE